MLHSRLGGGDHQPEAAAELYLREAHRPVTGVHPRVSGVGQVQGTAYKAQKAILLFGTSSWNEAESSLCPRTLLQSVSMEQ